MKYMYIMTLINRVLPFEIDYQWEPKEFQSACFDKVQMSCNIKLLCFIASVSTASFFFASTSCKIRNSKVSYYLKPEDIL